MLGLAIAARCVKRRRRRAQRARVLLETQDVSLMETARDTMTSSSRSTYSEASTYTESVMVSTKGKGGGKRGGKRGGKGGGKK